MIAVGLKLVQLDWNKFKKLKIGAVSLKRNRPQYFEAHIQSIIFSLCTQGIELSNWSCLVVFAILKPTKRNIPQSLLWVCKHGASCWHDISSNFWLSKGTQSPVKTWIRNKLSEIVFWQIHSSDNTTVDPNSTDNSGYALLVPCCAVQRIVLLPFQGDTVSCQNFQY